MMPNSLASEFIVERKGADRRKATGVAPPYLTAEGFVLIDRREYADRRAAPEKSANDSCVNQVFVTR
jgi:hypothetical protein